MKKLFVGLTALCLIKVDAIAIPAYEFGSVQDTTYDSQRDVFLNTTMRWDNWCTFSRVKMPNGKTCWDPVEIPAKKKLVFSFRVDLFREENWQYAIAGTVLIGQAKAPVRRRFVGINVESFEWPEESKVWPHLGLLYVGTVAEQEDYEVKLWDELIQGKAPLEQLIQPGDIVGLSLVTTGMERGVEIAKRVKTLGARYVVAGNDSAMFRARQLLSLPGQPVDAVFTSNSLGSIRQFFQQATSVELSRMQIPRLAVDPRRAQYVTNESSGVAIEAKQYGTSDFFLVPNLTLYGHEYWNLVWSAYRSQFGHKHVRPQDVRNAIALLAQGCGRAGAGDICDYCTIRHVANVSIPEQDYLEETLDTYRAFGINTFFNVTDSAFEMGPLVHRLKEVGPVDSMVIYGRAQAIARQPHRLSEWLDVVRHRLLINCGMDSADERILQEGIKKSSSKAGSRVEENLRAVRNIRDAGNKVHLHYSLIFGSNGETKDSCERNLEFVQWTIDMLGSQLDVCESDIFWVNFGSPCSVIFHSYEEASRRAVFAGKTISMREWERNFGRHANALVVPHESEVAWYRFFTNITYELALEYNARTKKMMEKVPDAIVGREWAFK